MRLPTVCALVLFAEVTPVAAAHAQSPDSGPLQTWARQLGALALSFLIMPVVRAVGCAVLFAWLTAGDAFAQALTVAAASDLQAALPSVAERFEKETGQKVALTFGSSGNFYTQIQNGAPFDVFLSADIEYPRRLERDGQAVTGSLFGYANGHIVLWTRNDSGIDVHQGLRVLVDPKVRHVAVANPEHAPYGRAAIAALRHEGLEDQIRAKLVFGENVSQAAQFAESGNSDVGLIAMSLALSPRLKHSGVYAVVPEAFYPAIEQAAVILTRSRQQAMARRFIDSLKTSDVRKIFESYGFAVPQTVR